MLLVRTGAHGAGSNRLILRAGQVGVLWSMIQEPQVSFGPISDPGGIMSKQGAVRSTSPMLT